MTLTKAENIMETKFTKGYWSYRATSLTGKGEDLIPTSFTVTKADDAGFYGKTIASIKPKDGGDLDRVRYDLEEAEANAKLIAAAPDMYEALKALLKSTYPNYKTVDDSQHPANLALKALKKATE